MRFFQMDKATPDGFIEFFAAMLPQLQPDDHLNALREKIAHFNAAFWNLRLVQSQSKFCGMTFLQAWICLLADHCPNDDVRRLLLSELAQVVSIEAWDARPPHHSAEGASEILMMTPRECLMHFSKRENNEVFLSSLSILLSRIPTNLWAGDVARYVLSSSQYVCRLAQLSALEIMRDEIDGFGGIPSERWMEKLEGRDCPPEMRGATFLYVMVSMLEYKLPQPEMLVHALSRIVEFVPALAWDETAGTKAPSANVKSNLLAGKTPRSLIWRLSQRENGYLFLSVLYPILNHLPSERWQAEIPEYLKGVSKIFLKQGTELTLSASAFFCLLVTHASVEEKSWFGQFDFNVDEKQKRKRNVSTAAVVVSPVCVLIDTFNAMLKKMTCNSYTCSALTLSLKLIAEHSTSEDWDPALTIDGTVDRNGPLNHLTQLFLDYPKDSYFSKIVETVLAKATQESVNYISRENREKLLAMPLFAKNKKLLNASCEKKSAPKSASKPSAKKTVVTASVKPAEKQASKKAMPKPGAKLTEKKSSLVQPASKNLSAVDPSDDEGFLPPPGLLPPIFKGRWCDDEDDMTGYTDREKGRAGLFYDESAAAARNSAPEKSIQDDIGNRFRK